MSEETNKTVDAPVTETAPEQEAPTPETTAAPEQHEAPAPAPKKSGSGFGKKLDNFFEITQRKSTIRTEVIAGLTTFFAMCYIILVNPDQVSGGMDQSVWNAVFVGGIIAAVIGTLLMAFLAKLPFAQAAGMGLNAFFMVCFVLPAENKIAGYQGGLVLILLSGIVFLILSATGARQFIAKALPDCLKKAIPAGIGLFIAFIGFKNAGIVVADRYTFVGLVDLTSWSLAAPALAAFLGLVAIVVLGKYKIKGNVILGILLSTGLYYLFCHAFTGAPVDIQMQSISTTFGDFFKYGVTAVFKGDSWVYAFSTVGVFNAICYIITFCLIDMFDTVGTLYGTAAQADMLDENGDPINMNKAMLCDSIATASGAVLGTSTVTTYVESSAGVAAGGRTGLTSVIVSLCFLVCLFVSPLAAFVPTVATAPALIYVGVLMLSNFGKVDMTDITNALPAFLALIIMPLTYSIANGIGVGAIAYVLIRLCTGKFTKSDIIVTVIAVLFAVRFALTFTGTYPAYVF